MLKGDIPRQMSMQLSKAIQNKLEKLLANVGDMSLKRRARRIIKELDPQDGDRIVDLGCGTGYYLFLLSNLGIRLSLTGFDYDERAINEARGSIYGKDIKFITGNLHKVPFQDKSFDKAVMSEVLEHVENDEKVLQEVYRILKPDGVLVISVPSINYPFLWDPTNWVLQHFFGTHIKKGFFSGIWNNHLRLYSMQVLRKKFAKAGFKIETAEELTFWCLPLNHYLVNLIARLLYDVKISSQIADKISKFKSERKPLMFDLAFRFVNWIDRLNEIFPQRNGVNIFVKAKKLPV